MKHLLWLAILLISAPAAAGARLPSPKHRPDPGPADTEPWKLLCCAIAEFHSQGGRAKFLAACKEVRAKYPDSGYDEQLRNLIEPLEREAATPPPALLAKKPEDRTPEETIRYWVYQLRDLAGEQHMSPGYPSLFAFWPWDERTAADQLVAIGAPAIPYLVEALRDDTPTRTVAYQRAFYPVRFVLRRQDVAMKCLERIVGCDFYWEGASYIHLYMDDPDRRQSALDNVDKWWALSKGASQAQMLRNQLDLMGDNVSLTKYDRLRCLRTLAALEGPEPVVEEARAMLEAETEPYSSMADSVGSIDPRAPVQGALRRFRQHASRPEDYYGYVLKYGDKAAYEELARRLASGEIDPAKWGGQNYARAAEFGGNWAIPIVAEGLTQTKMTGQRGSHSHSTADDALAAFQKLTGKDFGYAPDNSEEERQAAFARAREWWLADGQRELADVIAKDQPPTVDAGDLLLSDQEIDRLVAGIESTSSIRRWGTIRSLGTIYSYQVQRALLNVLDEETRPVQRMAILRILQQQPKLWHLPALTKIMRDDTDTATRVLAAQIIQAIVRNKGSMMWWTRLETRDAALDAARTLAQDPATPADLCRAAAEIVVAWGVWTDYPLLERLSADPVLSDVKSLQSRVEAIRKAREARNSQGGA
jgi:hypothetical protein